MIIFFAYDGAGAPGECQNTSTVKLDNNAPLRNDAPAPIQPAPTTATDTFAGRF